MKNITSLETFALESYTQLTSLEIINCMFMKISFPSSLVELYLRQCKEYTFDPSILGQLKQLRKFVGNDVCLTKALYEEEYPWVSITYY